MVKNFLLSLAVVLLAIQFVRPTRNESTVLSPNDISRKYEVPDGIQTTLKNACYDCHSNNTNYPWYANVQPVSWWLAEHINDGKKHLNFSEFLTYSPKKASHKMEEVIESQEDKWMPLDEYTWMHPEARLTDEQRGDLINWAKGIRQQIGNDTLPKPDSLAVIPATNP